MGMGHSVRHVLAALAFAGVLAFFCVLLVQAQVIQGEGYYETSLRSKAKVESVPAARGKILDRNGKVVGAGRGALDRRGGGGSAGGEQSPAGAAVPGGRRALGR